MKHNWQRWIDRLGSDDATEEDHRRFQDALNESPENVDDYLDALLTEVSLEQHEPEVAYAQQQTKRHWAIPASLAACAVLSIAGAYWLGSKGQQTPTTEIVENAAPHIATITDTDEIADASGLQIGAPLQKELIEVPDGSSIGIAMRNGARLQLNGPAKLNLLAADKVYLESGRMQAYAPKYAHGFTVDTTDGRIVDLGTRFVTATGTDLGTEVHVLEGLVETHTDHDAATHALYANKASILKNGKRSDTEFLAQRMRIPLDPTLVDSDGDGIPDSVERHFGSNPHDPNSTPELVKIEETFADLPNAPIGALQSRPEARWQGHGDIRQQGLTYSSNSKTLLSDKGSLETVGRDWVGAYLETGSANVPDQGVIYISFLLQRTTDGLASPYGGMVLNENGNERLFVGKLSITGHFGSRFGEAQRQDAFATPADGEVHLFVVRIDRTRFLTDIFLDPPLGVPESEITPHWRYQDAPGFDQLIFRSGSNSGPNPMRFDAIRLGLTWDAVTPVAE